MIIKTLGCLSQQNQLQWMQSVMLRNQIATKAVGQECAQ